MWIKFDLEGMKFEIQIQNQHRNTKYFEDANDWAGVSFNVEFHNELCIFALLWGLKT